ncbi:hypothetical protein BDY24DRAFT_278749 [Mrakia frigida]|uniref:uncharacterized protein n=1 Tax=Mrakia frigida TaxID=29902 RepID=UPI003FCC1712
MLSSHSPVMYSSEFDEFLRPSTPEHDPPPLSFDFGSSTGGPPSFFQFSASPPTGGGSSSSQSYSPPSSTTSGLPTEDEIFGMMNGVCESNEGGGAFGDVFSFGGLGGGGGGGASRSSNAHVHGLDLSRPPSTEFLDLDPFFQFGNNNNNNNNNNNPTNQNFLPQQSQGNHLGFAPNVNAESSNPNNNNPVAPIPSFLLSHINNASLFTQQPPNPLFSLTQHQHHQPPPPSSNPPSLAHSNTHSQPSSSASSIHSLAPPQPQTTSTTTKRKLSSTASPFDAPKQPASASTAVASSSQNGKVSDHNAIERKYRDHISDGFTRLRDSVPVLRVLLFVLFPSLFPQPTS